MPNPFQSALRDSEREIFNYGVHVKTDAEEFDAIADAEENDQIIAEQSQIEGFDGEHVSDKEGLARAIQGDDATDGYIGDRPLAYQHELAVERENEKLRQALAAERNQTGQLRQQYDPQVRAQQEFNRAQFLDAHGLVAVDENRANAFLAQQATIEQQQMRHHQQRIESSEARAIEEYGQRAYDDAIQAFKDIEHTPVAANIKQLVFNSPHPAKTLMAMMQDEGINSLRPEGGWAPPFNQTAAGRAQNYRPERSAPQDNRWPRDPDEMADSDNGVEQEIWGAAWR